MQQVCRIDRTVQEGAHSHEETAYAITSLRVQRASPERLLRLWRGHWGIENGLHYVRDVTLGEDACRVRTGSAPQLLAAMRNALLSVLRDKKVPNRAAAIRSFSWNRQKAAAAVGVPSLT